MTLYELLLDQLKDKRIWDYHVYSPISLDDEAKLYVVVVYGDQEPDKTETYTLTVTKILSACNSGFEGQGVER